MNKGEANQPEACGLLLQLLTNFLTSFLMKSLTNLLNFLARFSLTLAISKPNFVLGRSLWLSGGGSRACGLCCCSFRADEAAAFAVRTYARPQQLHSLESESDDMRGDTSLVLHCLCLARAAPALCSSNGLAYRGVRRAPAATAAQTRRAAASKRC